MTWATREIEKLEDRVTGLTKQIKGYKATLIVGEEGT